MAENDNDPNRRELNYSKAYRKKYEEKFGGKKLSGNQKVNGGVRKLMFNQILIGEIIMKRDGEVVKIN